MKFIIYLNSVSLMGDSYKQNMIIIWMCKRRVRAGPSRVCAELRVPRRRTPEQTPARPPLAPAFTHM
jgi:hypothetical protein